jgi:hypothetical protein
MGRLALRGHIGISAGICHLNRNPLQSDASVIVYRNGALTLLAAMTHIDRSEEPEDPKVLRSAAVDALKDAARQSDPREFNRLTRHALALIERARASGHGRGHAVSKAAAAPTI